MSAQWLKHVFQHPDVIIATAAVGSRSISATAYRNLAGMRYSRSFLPRFPDLTNAEEDAHDVDNFRYFCELGSMFTTWFQNLYSKIHGQGFVLAAHITAGREVALLCAANFAPTPMPEAAAVFVLAPLVQHAVLPLSPTDPNLLVQQELERLQVTTSELDPLAKAALGGELVAHLELLSRHADVHSRDALGMQAIHYACAGGGVGVVAELLQVVAVLLEVGLAHVDRTLELALELQVEFAAQGNELATDEIAFGGFAGHGQGHCASGSAG